MEREEYIINNLLVKDSKGHLKRRERNDLEYKKSFGMGSWAAYAKTMASFANNMGGYLLFGIKDTPREIVGVNNAFEIFKQEKFTEALNALFAPEIQWDVGSVEIDGKSIGYIYTWESDAKPVIAQKSESSEKINSGDIFYRYRGKNGKIRFPEMRKIIEERSKREQERIFKLIEAIKNSDTTNLGIVNYNNGHFSTPYGVDIAIDKKLVVQLLKKARYIKNGSFVEDGGQPVLKVTGNIDLAEEVPVPDVNPDIQYPYMQKDLKDMLGLTSNYQIQALIWTFGLKGQLKYHLAVSTSKQTKAHKYSKLALQYLKEKIEEHNDGGVWLATICKAYSDRPQKKKGDRT